MTGALVMAPVLLLTSLLGPLGLLAYLLLRRGGRCPRRPFPRRPSRSARRPRLSVVGWVGRLFDARDTFVRMLLLDLSGVGYLVFGPQAGRERRRRRSGCSRSWRSLRALILHRRPAVSLVVQTALLAVAFVLIDDTTINQVGTSWVLLELAMWAPRLSRLWWGVALVIAVYADRRDRRPAQPDRLDAVRAGRGGRRAGAARPGHPHHPGAGPPGRGTGGRGAAAARVGEPGRPGRRTQRDRPRAARRRGPPRRLDGAAGRRRPARAARTSTRGWARCSTTCTAPGTAALADLRRLVAVLRNPDGVRADAALTAIEPSALPAALSACRGDGPACRARGGGRDLAAAVGSLDAVRGLAVLRLTQEALTNVAKHAGAGARARLRVDGRGRRRALGGRRRRRRRSGRRGGADAGRRARPDRDAGAGRGAGRPSGGRSARRRLAGSYGAARGGVRRRRSAASATEAG